MFISRPAVSLFPYTVRPPIRASEWLKLTSSNSRLPFPIMAKDFHVTIKNLSPVSPGAIPDLYTGSENLPNMKAAFIAAVSRHTCC
jgi:hypothetical protein